MEKFIKENLVMIAIPIVILVGLLQLDYQQFNTMTSSKNNIRNTTESLSTKKQQLEQLQKEREEALKKPEAQHSKSNKVIYEVLGQQFSPEASFGIMFENLLANMTNSGIRIRSIEYNYKPSDDKVLSTNVPGYNACELSFTTVGTYSQLQNFFKNIVKENYITSIYEIYIEPYRRDKTILIAKFKVRLYTKTI